MHGSDPPPQTFLKKKENCPLLAEYKSPAKDQAS